MLVTQLKEFHDKADILTMREDATVSSAVMSLIDKDNTAILVTASNTSALCGIVTEQDLVRRFIPMGDGSADDVKLSQIMTKNPEVAHANDDVTDCVDRMKDGGYGHMPVLDEDENIIGVLCQKDFAAYTWPQIVGRAREAAQENIDKGGYEPALILLGGLLFVGLILAAATVM